MTKGPHSMTQADASRIQSTQAKAGHSTGAGTFAARAQSAAATNPNKGADGSGAKAPAGGEGGKSSGGAGKN